MCLRVFYLGDRPELSSRDGASVRATLSRGRANHNDVTPYDTNIRVMMFKVHYDPNIGTHLIRAVPELAQERVETATRVPEEHEGRMSRPDSVSCSQELRDLIGQQYIDTLKDLNSPPTNCDLDKWLVLLRV